MKDSMREFASRLPFLLLAILIPFTSIAEEDCIEAKRLVRRAVQLGDGSRDEIEIYQKAISICGSMAEAPFNIGVIYLEQAKISEAISYFRKALDIRDEEKYRSALASAYLAAKEYTKAEKEYRSSLDKDPSNITALQGLAIIAESRGDLEVAISSLEKARKFEPRNIVSSFNLAVLHEKNKNYPSAEELYQFVLQQDSGHVKSNLQLGLLKQRYGEFEESIPFLEKAVIAEPSLAVAHRALGVALEEVGDLEKSELAFQKASRLNPEDDDSRINLAVILIKKEQQALAEEMLKGILSKDNNNARAKSVLGWALLELGKYEEAERSLKSALEVDATNARAHNNLGVLYQRLGKEEEAVQEFSKAYQLDPSLESARENFERFK